MKMDKTRKNSESSLAQFCSVTGADATVGKQLLEACGGNLELAINMHMEGGGATTSAAVDSVRAPIPQIQETLVDDSPAYGIFRGRKRKTRSVFDGFRDFQEEALSPLLKRPAILTYETPSSIALVPPESYPFNARHHAGQQEEEIMAGTSRSLASRKTKTLQDLFRPPIDITYKGNLANARETGKTQGKWLMVNIQNVQEFPCQALNRDVWSNSAVKALIKDNFIFWQVYHDSEEGQRYTQFYKVDRWPYVAVLDPQTGENMVVWNNIEPLTFCDLVAEFLTRHPTAHCLSPTQPAAKRVRREDSVIDATEDDQLQAAIKASLTEVSKPETSKNVEFVNNSDSEGSDLETFTDSEEETESSPVKTRKLSNMESHQRSQGKKSPTRKHSPKRDSGDEGSRKEKKVSSPVRRSVRCNSPLAGSSGKVDSQSSQRKCSPQRTRKGSPGPESVSSRKSSPSCRKLSPKKTSSPQKSESIHNDVHPAVLENIRRNSVSEEDENVDSKDVEESNSEISETEDSDKSVENVTDSRDYKSYLGPETDEKTTLMLRLPDGQREKLTIAFSSKLLALVLFVGSKGFSNERFELIAQFPRRQLSQLDYHSTLRDIGIHAQETIFVQARS